MDASGHEYMELKQRVCAANREISRTGLAILTWGNVSEVDRDAGVFAIKPSGVAYDDLSPDDIVLVSIDTGEKLQGKLAPSSDSATHAEIYRSFGAVGGVVHTHSHFGTAWAQAQREIPCYGTTHADTFFGPVPVTRMLSEQEVKDAYEVNTGKVIVERFHDGGLDPIAVPGVLVAGHAPSPGDRPRPARWRTHSYWKRSRAWRCTRSLSRPRPKPCRNTSSTSTTSVSTEKTPITDRSRVKIIHRRRTVINERSIICLECVAPL